MALEDYPRLVTHDQLLSPGMAIIVAWPNYTLVPLQSKLDATAQKFGNPFQLTYWDAQHVGIELTKEVLARDVYLAFAKIASGNSPVITSVPPDSDTIVNAEVNKKRLEDAVALGLKALEEGTIAGAKLPATGASWMNYIPYVLVGAGVLFVGYKAYRYFSKRKRGGR